MAETAERAGGGASSTLLTFLIADVRGYTSYGDLHGDEAIAGLAQRFAELVEEIAGAHDGRLIELRGDEALAAFVSTRGALRAAVDLQERFAAEIGKDHPVEIGIGLDAGDAVPVRGGYRSGALNVAARLQALAHGAVFATETVVGLARRTEGLVFVDRGDVDLRGMSHPVRVIQVAREGSLPGNLSPLQTVVVAHPTNLPDEPTSFIGRERELVELVELLKRTSVRLLTLTGPGGTGKTRLALHLGGRLLFNFQDGVFFVSLAPLADPALVLPTIAEALQVQPTAGELLVDTLVAALKGKDLLLILDNFEHLAPATNSVAQLLDACTGLRIVVTSRAPLRLQREHEYSVPPLSLPPRLQDQPIDPAALEQYEAVALFVERSRAVKQGFALRPDNAAAIAEICAQLDGLPLAIELAASRIRLFPPRSLAARLKQRLAVLTGGPRDLPTRQQTLRATIDWSYSLLDEADWRLFARLSVFAGGCAIEAAELVGGDDTNTNVLDSLESLVEKSLLRQSGQDEPRFIMLATIREYATERLEASGDAEAIRSRFADYCLAFAESAEAGLRGPDQHVWVQRLEDEHDNLRAALQWLLDRRDAERAQRLAAALWLFWWMRGYFREGCKSLQEALEHDGNTDRAIRAKALAACAVLAMPQRLWDLAEQLYEESLQLYNELGDQSGIAAVKKDLARIAHGRGNDARAVRLYEEAIALTQETGDRAEQAGAMLSLGILLVEQGKYDVASTLLETTREMWQDLQNPRGVALAQVFLAYGTLLEGQADRTEELLYQVIPLAQELEERVLLMYSLEGLAGVAIMRERPKRAARLFSAAQRERERSGMVRASPRDIEAHEDFVARGREQAGEETWSAAWNEGSAMTLEAAVEYALRKQAVR